MTDMRFVALADVHLADTILCVFGQSQIPDSAPGIFLLVICIGVLVLATRVIAGEMDDDRVRDYIVGQGWRFISCQWTPFGPGWAGERSDRIYEVRYIDKEGNEHLAYCKTSMGTGVYLTQDKIVRRNAPAKESLTKIRLVELETENRQLREKLRQIQNG